MKEEIIDISKEMALMHQKMLKKGLKSTPQRDEIARWIFQVHSHFTVDDLIAGFHEEGKRISSATAYRVIQMMLDLGLLIEHDFGKGYKHFEHVPGHHDHDHIICSQCGKIVEFTDERLNAIREHIEKENDFIVENHVLNFYGICSDCRKENKRN